jgi:hypothetical protein
MRTTFTHYYKTVLFISLFIIFTFYPLAQAVDFQSSNLPILVIDTHGRSIPDKPKITAHLGIIYNGEGERNDTSDAFNEYNGVIGIEMRGYSSQNWPKKPYGFETRTETGENNNVSLLGMPSENDWVLHAPYVDKTLLRNVLLYKLARELGWYAPRTRFCELLLNGEYMGVYVLIEKLKIDKDRLDLSAPDAADLSGGYLLEMTLSDRVEDDESSFICRESEKAMVIKYPDKDDITPEQQNWITDYINGFESLLNEVGFDDPETGYPKYIDIPSFIDHMLLAEGFNQLDAFSHSQYFYKVKNGKLFNGPGWDFNRTIGNASYYTSWATNEWWLRHPRGGHRAFWPGRLMDDPAFMLKYSKRWFELRQTIFSYDYIFSLIDQWVVFLEEAKLRNFERWPVLGVSINNKYAFDTYEEEIAYMKNWIRDKFTWLDEQFEGYENPNFIFADDPYFGDAINYSPLTALRWSIVQDQGDYRYFLNSTDFGNLSGERLGEYSLIRNRTYGDFKMSFKARSNENFDSNAWADFCVVFGYRDAENYCYAMFNSNPGENGNAIYAVISGHRVKIAEVDLAAITDNIYHQYEIERIGSAIHLRKDGQTYLSANDSRLSGNGSLGVGSYNDSAFFDDIFIINISQVADGAIEINDFILRGNYPNPFNASTKIQYQLSEGSSVDISVLTPQGEKVITLFASFQPAGNYSVVWDGKNSLGKAVSSGLYIVQLKAGKRIHSHKLILLK